MVPTSQRTQPAVIRKKGQRLMLFREIIAVRCHKIMEQINIICGQNTDIFSGKANGTVNVDF